MSTLLSAGPAVCEFWFESSQFVARGTSSMETQSHYCSSSTTFPVSNMSIRWVTPISPSASHHPFLSWSPSLLRFSVFLACVVASCTAFAPLRSAVRPSHLFMAEEEVAPMDLNLEEMFEVFDEADKAAPTPVSVSSFDPKSQVGITAPLGFFDPLGFATGCGEDQFKLYQEAETKHGRVAMLAFVGPYYTHPKPLYTSIHPYTPLYTPILPYTPLYTPTPPYTSLYTPIHPYTPLNTPIHYPIHPLIPRNTPIHSFIPINTLTHSYTQVLWLERC